MDFRMTLEALNALLKIDRALSEAEARKKHYEARLVEIINRRTVNEGTRRRLIERLAGDIYDTALEIEGYRRRMDEIREASA